MQYSVNADSTAFLDIIFYDEKDTPTTPASIEYKIEDYESGDSLKEGTITPDRVVRLTLPPSVNTLTNSDEDDIRVVTVTAKYGDDNQQVERFMYKVDTLV